MADFSGEAGLSVEELAAHDHSHSKAPAEVEEKARFFASAGSRDVFAVSHGPGIVLHDYMTAETLFQQLADGFFLAYEIGVAVSRALVYTAGEGDAVGFYP